MASHKLLKQMNTTSAGPYPNFPLNLVIQGPPFDTMGSSSAHKAIRLDTES